MFEFTAPFRETSGSPIRELFKYLGEPGMISLAGGYPSSDLFDVERLQQSAAAAWREPARCLQYAPTDGLPELKHEVMRLMQQRGVDVAADQLMLTTGSQQGLDLLLRVLINPGDGVLVEQPAYPATLQALRKQQARIVTVPVDADGLDVERLTAMLESGECGKPKLLYTVPTFANPTGATLSRERRVALIELAVKYGFLIVEDDPYGDLRFTGEHVPAVRALAGQIDGGVERVVYFGSLSKIVAPGLRVGWTVAHPDIVRRCVIAKQTADLCSAPYTQAIAADYLAQGFLAVHLPRIIAAYRRKCDLLCDELDAQLAGRLQFQRPHGGMFVWVRVEGVDSSELLTHAIAQKVLFVPGRAFYADQADASSLRLSFAGPGIEEIGEAASRLARACKLATL
ncbi:2-aminoadipate transaminase [Paraburkholderia sp. GAS199]|uniref:aminotransferase-like domain-containing protein n=1 Tax=Paraburkholderia sp. GAS199 TaxID=3035126 RepID=UPI003D193FDE